MVTCKQLSSAHLQTSDVVRGVIAAAIPTAFAVAVPTVFATANPPAFAVRSLIGFLQSEMEVTMRRKSVQTNDAAKHVHTSAKASGLP